MTNDPIAAETPPFHKSATYWVAIASWLAWPVAGVAFLIDRSLVIRFALAPLWIVLAAHALYQFSILWSGYRSRLTGCVLFTIAVAAGVAAAPISGWHAGATISACLALLLSFSANWVLSIAWQLNWGIAAQFALFASIVAIPALIFAQPFLWWPVLFTPGFPTLPILSSILLVALIALCIALSWKARYRARALLFKLREPLPSIDEWL